MKKTTARAVDRVLALSCSHLLADPQTGQPPQRNFTQEQPVTVGSVMQSVGPQVRQRIKPLFERAGIDYPPRRVSLIFLKDVARMELWASCDGKPSLIARFPFKSSGTDQGPKLSQDDGLVPEGVYRVTTLNPDRSGYLAMKLNYPNLLDLKYASRDARHRPGGDICILAGSAGDGCIAISESISETLFVLLADVGLSSVTVLISPNDPRVSPLQAPENPRWVSDLYRRITDAFEPYSVVQ